MLHSVESSILHPPIPPPSIIFRGTDTSLNITLYRIGTRIGGVDHDYQISAGSNSGRLIIKRSPAASLRSTATVNSDRPCAR